MRQTKLRHKIVVKVVVAVWILAGSLWTATVVRAQAAAGQPIVKGQQALQELGGKGQQAAGAQAGLGQKDTTGKQTPPSGQDKTSGTKPASVGEQSASTTTLRLGPLDPSTPPKDLPKNRPVIGLAMGGGAALALSEIGTLRWMEEHHIPVDVIAGTSMGSILAALYSTGRTPDQMEHILDPEEVSRVFRISSAYASKSFRRREDSREIPNAIGIGLKHGVSLRNSLLIDTGLNELLDKEFIRYNDQTDFNNLPIPFRCQATDLNAGKSVTFARGSLQDAVRASASLPGVFQPFQLDGHEYVDGAILENLPTPDVKAMGADVIIAVSLPLGAVGKGDLDSILGVLQRAFAVGIENNEARDRKLANVVIVPDVSGFSANDYSKSKELAARGYAAAEAQKAELMKYSLPEKEWEAYLAKRKAKERPPVGMVLAVKVKAPDHGVEIVAHRKFDPLINQPVDTNKIESLLADLRSDGRYNADYTVGYDSKGSDRPILLIDVEDKKTGPPFLDIGFNIAAQTGGVTRATVQSIVLDQDFGGYGSELRGKIDVGFLTLLEGEYYRKLTASGYFVAPRANLTRQPYYIYSGNTRLSERQSQFGGVGVDGGWSDSRSQELRAGWSLENVQWHTTTGFDNLPDYAGNSQTARVRYVFDNQDRALVPRYGLRLTTDLGYLYDTPGSPAAPQLFAQVEFAHSFDRNNIVLGNIEGGTMFNRDVAQPFRYTLGGPLRLSAEAIDQLRGTDYFLITPGYMHRIATLPQPLGQRIYVGGTFELGQMRSPDGPTITREDVYLGLVAETPIGVVTFAPAFGSNGQHKLVFTIGKFF
jgi:NTE family protein